VGGGYFSGPGFDLYGLYSWYPYSGAAFWDPFWSPYSSFAYLPNVAYRNDKGEIRLTTDPKQAEVYIDGAYAGTADHLKTIWLDPGAYDLSVSHTGRESFHKRVYILTGKLLKVTAKLPTQGSITGTKEEKQ
jgi:PEGA domain